MFFEEKKLEIFLVVALLTIAATFEPIMLYIFALAIFGFPHVLWELSWVKKLYGNTLNTKIWVVLWMILSIQIVARTFNWLSIFDSKATLFFDVLTLALIFALAGIAISGCKKNVLNVLVVAALLFISGGLIYSLGNQSLLIIVLSLSIIHNFTPILLVMVSPNLNVKKLTCLTSLTFTIPLILLTILSIAPQDISVPGHYYSDALLLGEASWIQKNFPDILYPVLSSLVLAQCLHYYSVIRIIPYNLGNDFSVQPNLWWAIVISFSFVVFFSFNYASAKSFYAIFAGTHAWLEWALLAIISGKYLTENREMKLSNNVAI